MNTNPPNNIWEADKNLQYNEPLDEKDPRYVHTEKGRGDFSYMKLLRSLGVNHIDYSLASPPGKIYKTFCGHRGCGKSTELKRLRVKLDKEGLFFVVFLDATVGLDNNNLQYPDLFMALARSLTEKLQEKNISLDKVFLSNLETWFNERVSTQVKAKDFALNINAGVEGKTGIPFLSNIFANITTSFKQNSTYKEELRMVIKNSFTQFGDAFNQFILAAEEAVKEKGRPGGILFIIDGTDRLSGEDSENLFIKDSHQLQYIASKFIYCAAINLLHEGMQLHHAFDSYVLPMIKVHEKNSDTKVEAGYETMREMLYKRVDKSLFDSEETVDYIIRHSGGCPREFFKILHYAFRSSKTDLFDRQSTEQGVKDLSTDYKRMLEDEDYLLLAKIDREKVKEQNDSRTKNLLYNLALFEYNNFWRQSHPVVRLLPGYKEAKKQIEK